jgi:uncharacterized protein YuzE
MIRQAAYYDREARIVYFKVRRRRRRGDVYDEEFEWGTIERAEADDEICGVEIWTPKEMFPEDLLEALPHPTFTRWTRVWWWWYNRRRRLWN